MQPSQRAATALPQGLHSVDVARTVRVHRAHELSAALSTPPGLSDADVARSPRVAMADAPANPKPAPVSDQPMPSLASPRLLKAGSRSLAGELAKQADELTAEVETSAPAAHIENVPLPANRPVKVAEVEPVSPVKPSAPSLENRFSAVLAGRDAPLPVTRPTRTAVSAPTPKPVHETARVRNMPLQQVNGRGPQVLAYAGTDDHDNGMSTGLGVNNSVAPHRRGVAVYDIKAAKVYMPNGETLEAHSGLGRYVDNPRYANRKNRGPTPPNVYNLSMRKHLFHGVRAVRMLPADGHNKYGRNGFLAHTYMLRGRPAESNGCVVFKHYAKFLKAFEKGRIKKLVVVPQLKGSSFQVASR